MAHGKELLRKRWQQLQASPRELGGAPLARWRQDRGYKLERLLVDLARLEKLDAEPSYRGRAEQIDGYFAVDHRHFLLEARWRRLPATASDVFAFQGKLRGKLAGTLGLFVSIGDLARLTGGDVTSQMSKLAAELPIETARMRSRSFGEFVCALEEFAPSKLQQAS